jgi:hypothetical protein
MKKIMFIMFFSVTVFAVIGQQNRALELSGFVFEKDGGNAISYSLFTRSLTVTRLSGSGRAEGGRLSMTISQTPSKLYPFNETNWLFNTPGFLLNPSGQASFFGIDMYGNKLLDRVVLYNVLNFSESNVEYESFSSLDAGGNSELVRESFTGTMTNLTHEMVEYIYVTRDITITGSGKTTSLTDKNGRISNITTDNINLKLTRGWNTVYTKTNRTQSQSNGINMTIEMSVKDPANVGWLFYIQRGV